uniref:Mougrin n=1 Tax=Ornithodoros moubata TaxID=6938 RepID=M9WFX3_ORNMO|nr:mougrin [Ornithodoros moubata]
MQAKILVFAFVLLSVAVLAYGYVDECNETPMYRCPGDEDRISGWTYDHSGSENDCRRLCGEKW